MLVPFCLKSLELNHLKLNFETIEMGRSLRAKNFKILQEEFSHMSFAKTEEPHQRKHSEG